MKKLLFKYQLIFSDESTVGLRISIYSSGSNIWHPKNLLNEIRKLRYTAFLSNRVVYTNMPESKFLELMDSLGYETEYMGRIKDINC